MKKSHNKVIGLAMAAVTALSLAACSTDVAESAFDNPLPWHDAAISYERLEYDVAIYDTAASEAEDKRVKIADGSLTFVLDEGLEVGYTTLSADFSVKYVSSENAGEDAGLTDTMQSTVVFEPKSMAAKSMTKTVTLADREGKANLSYTVTADYFDTHKATLLYTAQQNAKQKTISLPRDACRDNEMMFFLARAQSIGESTSTNFNMVNIFDSFNLGELTEYNISVIGAAKHNVDIGDFVKDFGIEAVTDETTSATSYPVKCRSVGLTINEENHGPSYTVLYSEDPFTENDIEHKKLPIRISYGSYVNSKPYRLTEYTLSACTFVKQ